MKKISTILEKIINRLLIIFIFLLTMSTVLQVVSRFILKSPIIWTEEVSRTTFIWIALLGSALATKYNQHLSLDFLSSKVSKKVMRFINIIVHGMMMIVAVIFIVGGWSFVQKNIGRVSVTTGMPMYYLYISAPIAGAFILFFLIEKIPALIFNK